MTPSGEHHAFGGADQNRQYRWRCRFSVKEWLYIVRCVRWCLLPELAAFLVLVPIQAFDRPRTLWPKQQCRVCWLCSAVPLPPSFFCSIWDLATAQWTATLVGHEWGLTGLSLTSDGATCISSSGDETIKYVLKSFH